MNDKSKKLLKKVADKPAGKAKSSDTNRFVDNGLEFVTITPPKGKK